MNILNIHMHGLPKSARIIILNKKSYNVDFFTSVKTIVISGDYPQNESR